MLCQYSSLELKLNLCVYQSKWSKMKQQQNLDTLIMNAQAHI